MSTTPPATATPPATGGRREPRRVGAVRPSQLIHTYGVGSLVELPNFSVIVSGIDRWDRRFQAQVPEPRLVEALRTVCGPQLGALYHAPREQETANYWDDWAWIGVPAYPFPRWMRCTKCKVLARIDQGVFEPDVDPVRTHKSRFFHQCGGKKHLAQPVRVVAACAKGHLDDFPWLELVHLDRPCTKPDEIHLELHDLPGGARATEQKARCRECGQDFVVRQAFTQRAAAIMPGCRGRHPHLHSFDPKGCDQQLVAQLVGASNAWFACQMSALSLPAGGSDLDQLVVDLWHLLEPITDKIILGPMLNTQDLAPLRAYDPDDVWKSIEKKRSGPGGDPDDLLLPEWQILTDPNPPSTPDFHATIQPTPPKYAPSLDGVVAVDRLREVAALYGFTRIAAADDDDPQGHVIAHRARICANDRPEWLPATENRGEGIFFQLPEATVVGWESNYVSSGRYSHLQTAHKAWRANRGLDPALGMPPPRYLLLHSIAHVLINEISVECGYNAASIRERIYSRGPNHPAGAMAGVLLYTAAPDSEGTLGGLVALSDPAELERLLDQAIARARLCTADPHCADHTPGDHDDKLHGAACATCLFVPETSCERGNKYLDRAVITDTLSTTGIAYPWI